MNGKTLLNKQQQMSPERAFILPSTLTENRQQRTIEGRRVIHLQATGQVLEGGLNTNHILSDPKGQLYVWRRQKDNPSVLTKISEEFNQTGFLSLGGHYRFRTPQEQVEFMENATQLGLKSIAPLYTDGYGILLPFIDGVPFDAYLRQGNITASSNALDNLHRSHELNVVYGDRWVKNTMVIADEDIIELDFDIELQGSSAKEFELTQTLYHMLHFSTDRAQMLNFLNSYYRNNSSLQRYDIAQLQDFLGNYAIYFQDTKYEGILEGVQEEVTGLIRILGRNSLE